VTAADAEAAAILRSQFAKVISQHLVPLVNDDVLFTVIARRPDGDTSNYIIVTTDDLNLLGALFAHMETAEFQTPN